jgi:two-component system, OmpR family, response regulator
MSTAATGSVLLLVEDDDSIGRLVKSYLEQQDGWRVVWLRSGEEAVAQLRRHPVRLVVLDIGLPGIDGFEVCRRLRSDGVRSPVLMLTARDAVEDRVRGLDTGADDYLTKPFSLAELAARLRAIARRGPIERPPVLEAGGLRLDPATRRVWRGNAEIALSAREFALLDTLMRHPGQVLDRLQLLDHAWDGEYENRSNVIDVYIRYLREKVDRPFGADSIETVRGVGYRLRENA